MPKLYQSETWLRREYLVKKKNAEKIAEEQGVAAMTIYRYLKKFGLSR